MDMAMTPPVSTADPFSREFFADPFPTHAALRDAGPVVRLSRYDIWAVARYEEVYRTLRDWETFTSARGVGLSDFKKEPPWRLPSLLLETDPPFHDRIRKVLVELRDYEHDVLFPIAGQNIELDLDAGVLVNYQKLGPALKEIGLKKNGSDE